jgi:hypothetical protein
MDGHTPPDALITNVFWGRRNVLHTDADFLFWWGLIHSKGARTSAASTPIGPRAHAVESKAVVRIEVAVSPRPCLGCAVEKRRPVLLALSEHFGD